MNDVNYDFCAKKSSFNWFLYKVTNASE